MHCPGPCTSNNRSVVSFLNPTTTYKRSFAANTRFKIRFALVLIVATLFVVAAIGGSAARFPDFSNSVTDIVATPTNGALPAAKRSTGSFDSPLFAMLRNAVDATVTTDKNDYRPGQTALITGSGWKAGETVTLRVVHTDGTADNQPPHQPWNVTALPNGTISSSWLVDEDAAGAVLRLTADGQSSGLHAEKILTDAIADVDFKQGANNDTSGETCSAGTAPNCEHWITSIVQKGNSDYFEGMTNPQRIVFDNMPSTTVHTLTFNHQFTKGGIHAYDFLAGYYDAQNIVPTPHFSPPLEMNLCGVALAAALLPTCTTLHT